MATKRVFPGTPVHDEWFWFLYGPQKLDHLLKAHRVKKGKSSLVSQHQKLHGYKNV